MLRVFSYGGGVQSTAALVLAATGAIDYRVFAFANVGDDSEHPASLDYVRNVAMPYAESHGIELVELRKLRRDGTPMSLMDRINTTESSIPLPVRMQNGAPQQTEAMASRGHDRWTGQCRRRANRHDDRQGATGRISRMVHGRRANAVTVHWHLAATTNQVSSDDRQQRRSSLVSHRMAHPCGFPALGLVGRIGPIGQIGQ